jgi:hypothetical protein
MASETVQLTAICTGNNHLEFTLTGLKAATVRMLLDELTEPISDADGVIFCKCIAKLAKSGRTVPQTRTLLQAGVTVNI